MVPTQRRPRVALSVPGAHGARGDVEEVVLLEVLGRAGGVALVSDSREARAGRRDDEVVVEGLALKDESMP